jgi:phosphate-selective porin OprO/OprP
MNASDSERLFMHTLLTSARHSAAPLVFAACLTSAAAHAQDTTTQAATTQPAAQATVARRQAETGAIWDGRPSFRLGDGSRVDLHARVQSDYLLRDDAGTADDAEPLTFDDRLSMARKRVGVSGELFDRVEFQVEGEVGIAHPWRDVFADVRLSSALRIRAGRFKVPFSQEQLTSATDLDFVARAGAVSDIAPARDLGVMAHGRLANRALKYEAGVFESASGQRLWKAGSARTLAARLTLAPLADGRSRGSDALELFAAYARGDLAEGRDGIDGHFALGETFFEPMFVKGTRTRLGAGGAWHSHRVSLAGELLRALDTRLGQRVDGGDLSELTATGGYVSGVWHAVPHRRRGASPLLRGVDVGVRLDRLTFGSATTTGDAYLNPRADRVAPIGRTAWTGGATWFVNRWVKVQANALREQIVDPQSLLSISPTPFWSSVLRFQVSM